jgi:hypothetical protein
LLLSASADFLLAAGWDYVDGPGIAYGLLCVEELGASAAASSRRTAILRSVFAGMAYAAAVHVQVYLLVFAPVLAAVFLGRTGKRGLFLVLPILAGFAALTGGLGLINVALGGSFLFFTPSVSTGTHLLKADPFYRDPWHWVAGAWWLVVPCALGVASLLFLIQMATRITSNDGSRAKRIARMADASSLPLLLLICIGLTAVHFPSLQYPFYASYLLVFTSLSTAALIGRRLDTWSTTEFVGLAAACATLAILVGAEIPSHLPTAIAVTYTSFRDLPKASPAVFAAMLAGGIVLGGIIKHRLASTLVVAVTTGIVLIHLGDVRIPERVGGTVSRSIYLDIDHTTRELGRLSREQSLWFWYSYKPDDDYHYTSICSTYLWAMTLLGRALPATADFRFDALHVGTYVALMDDHESTVDQAIAGLRARGVTLAPVERLRSSVYPTKFGISLLRVTMIEMAPIVYALSPAKDAVRPVGELLNYDLEGLLTHTEHAVYGREPAKPFALPRGVFKITDTRDHFRTYFQPIDTLGSSPIVAVEVNATDPSSIEEFGSVNMVFQDQDCRTLYSSGTLPGGEGHTRVGLPPGTRSVRVAFLANDRGFIKFPRALQLRTFTNK